MTISECEESGIGAQCAIPEQRKNTCLCALALDCNEIELHGGEPRRKSLRLFTDDDRDSIIL